MSALGWVHWHPASQRLMVLSEPALPLYRSRRLAVIVDADEYDALAAPDLLAAVERAARVHYERSYGSWDSAPERIKRHARERVRPLVVAALGVVS